jgi:hypothetical protein
MRLVTRTSSTTTSASGSDPNERPPGLSCAGCCAAYWAEVSDDGGALDTPGP